VGKHRRARCSGPGRRRCSRRIVWAAAAQDIGWQEAVARLAQERTLAETCAALLKK
jgi:hypothetical protein